MTKGIVVILPLLFLCLAGCANFNSVFRELDTNKGVGALIDIKQRAIIANKTGDITNQRVVVCAEPSPDALSAYAAELAAKADLPNGVSAQLSSAFQESASFTGLRTQSIQLLRDSMFRICEAYMNGAINEGQYDLLARRYQKHTVALLAIEQLTGAIKSPPITINTTGSAEAARSISVMRFESSALDKKISDLEKKKNDSSTPENDKKSLDEEIKQIKSDKEVISKGIENAKGTLVSGNATSTVSVVGLPTQRSDEHIQAIAATVGNIVTEIITAGDTGQLCFLHLAADSNKLSDDGKKLQEYCSQALAFEQAVSNFELEALQESLRFVKSSNSDSAMKATEIMRILDRVRQIKKETSIDLLGAPALQTE